MGDIAGPILPKPGPDYQRNRTICNAINANLATLKPEHLSRCFERSRKRQLEYLEQVSKGDNRNPPPAGVIALVRGVKDKDALLVALAEGYVNRVIMDYELEKSLISRIKQYDGNPSLEQLLD